MTITRMGGSGTRGILDPAGGFSHFSLEREAPPDDLAHLIESFWTVRWNLDGEPPFEQEILPYPCVNLSLQGGNFEVHGPGTQRFVARLSGQGWVVGTKFNPAGFFPFATVPMRTLVDRVVSVEAATSRTVPLPDDTDPTLIRAAVADFLRPFRKRDDATIALVNHLVTVAQNDRTISRADDLAKIADTSLRSLHRLFERYVGVGPKWIVRRSRVQDAADRVARGERIDWAATAQELGYHDQAHLIHDFSAQVGATPAAYARRCAASATSRSATAEPAPLDQSRRG